VYKAGVLSIKQREGVMNRLIYINKDDYKEAHRFMGIAVYTLREAHNKFRDDKFGMTLISSRGTNIDSLGYLEQISNNEIEFIEINEGDLKSIYFKEEY
jgi:hypothetical protein